MRLLSQADRILLVLEVISGVAKVLNDQINGLIRSGFPLTGFNKLFFFFAVGSIYFQKALNSSGPFHSVINIHLGAFLH